MTTNVVSAKVELYNMYNKDVYARNKSNIINKLSTFKTFNVPIYLTKIDRHLLSY